MTKKKDVFFNDLSTPVISEVDVGNLVADYAETVGEAYKQGFGKVCYENGLAGVQLTSSQSLQQYCFEHQNEIAVRTLLALQKRPYIQPDSNEEAKFVLTDSFSVEINGESVSAYAFAAAVLHDSILVGFAVNGFSERTEYCIKLMQQQTECYVKTLCLTNKEQFFSREFIEWADTHLEPTLCTSEIHPSQKKVHIAHHHGICELEAFAQRLLNEPYVVEIVNSIEWNSSEKSFVVDKHDDIVKLRLTNSERGYGLAVRTTARNERELNYICRLLEKKYG